MRRRRGDEEGRRGVEEEGGEKEDMRRGVEGEGLEGEEVGTRK